MTPDMKIAFDRLSSKVESTDHSANGDVWGNVYLENAIPSGWDGRKWAGVLSALSKAGLYKDEDGTFKGDFGRVKIS